MKNKKISLLVIAMLTALLPLTANIDYYPTTMTALYVVSDAEEINSRAIEGIDQITGRYNTDILLPVRFYHSSVNPEHSSESLDAFLDEFLFLEPGTMIINQRRISNPDLPVETGEPYNYLVQREYYRASPLRMSVSGEVNGSQLSAAVDITLLSETETLEDGRLVIIVVEDNVAADISNLARDVRTFDISLAAQNQSELKEADFDIHESWDADNLEIVAFVETEEGETIQSASTYINNVAHLRAAFPYPRIDIAASEGFFEAEYFGVFAMGGDLNLTINVELDKAPEAWDLSYCDDQGSCYFGPYNFNLSQGQGAAFHSNIFPEGPGMMDYHFTLTSPSFLTPYIIPLRYISDDVDVMVIDGDGWQNYEDYIAAALDETEYTYGVWSVTMADIDDAIQADKMAWVTGEREPALDVDEISFLRNYILNGGSLFISGQNIGEYLVEKDYYQDTQFYRMYLNAVLKGTDSELLSLEGVEGDPVSDGLSFSLNGDDSAGNQISPSYIKAADPERGSEILSYSDDRFGAVRTLNPLQRGSVVYLAFGFEGIDDAASRRALLENSLEWYSTTDIEEDPENPQVETNIKLMQSYPNPFSAGRQAHRSGNILISYYLSENSEQASLSIFNARGQLVRNYDELPVFEEGYGYIEWDGRHSSGRKAANGIYLYKLTDGYEEEVRKLSIIR